MDRKSQNNTLSEFNELENRLIALRPLILEVLVRATGDSGLRRNVGKRGDLESGTPPPYYADPTGEIAMRRQFADSLELKIRSMSEHLHYALNLAKNILDITPPDVAERAKREVPDCMACGDPCHGRVRSGFDDKCYTRWLRAGRPDRAAFISHIKQSQGDVPSIVDSEKKDWRVDVIDDLQKRGTLPHTRD